MKKMMMKNWPSCWEVDSKWVVEAVENDSDDDEDEDEIFPKPPAKSNNKKEGGAKAKLQQMTLDDDDDELWLASPWMETQTKSRMIVGGKEWNSTSDTLGC